MIDNIATNESRTKLNSYSLVTQIDQEIRETLNILTSVLSTENQMQLV